jgi:hypothetical protein
MTYAPLAQRIEHWPSKPRVEGSNPSGRTIYAGVAQLVELQPSKLIVEGSSPFSRSREVSSAGRASRLHREGHRFEPCTSHHIRGIAQPGSASALGAEGRRFKSCYPDHTGENYE